ncbi:pentapeptide repeat-containing protein [Pseudomonas syringae pv. actinidiae ICMP 19073]|uniref:pentapeptide repeat-containing protein n=1 Tax=Pseudomonas syringae TaxID=317 RepID=UPI000357DD62|nr:pentapeptide repeat-containing protein [Pseudomonas syringae]EPM47278.1 pentapeptide repeat-containing protein [Pseudomonas syringae pv. actinidiae ICMP 19073]
MSQPKQIDSPLYMLLRQDDVKGFNQEKPRTGTIDMTGGDFRGLDLRALDTTGIDFTDAYFRSADLRGLDLRHIPMEGASIAHAQISGVFFPAELSADEILMSVNFGTRLRYRTH